MENTIGISLGFNCTAAVVGVETGIRKTKHEGYLTCPFDECVTNLKGVIQCLQDDFKYFTDSRYLILKQYHVDHQDFIYNTRYNFFFNHESPGHADLYKKQNWSGGINHYILNDFEQFKKRYDRRINNFRTYLRTENVHITFLLSRMNCDTTELQAALHSYHSPLSFTIYNVRPPLSLEALHDHYIFMEHSEEEIAIELHEEKKTIIFLDDILYRNENNNKNRLSASQITFNNFFT
jgi:hypothetical protein